MSMMLTRPTLLQAAHSWLSAGKRVVGPRRASDAAVRYGPLAHAEELVTGGFVHPTNSIKPFLFPPHEKLFAYQGQGGRTQLVPFNPSSQQQIILAARPCDAAAIDVLHSVFHQNVPDPFFQQRRAATTVVTLACRQHDDDCFCTSVGLGPDATRGSDALLVPLDDEHFEARCITPRGEQLLESWVVPSERTGAVPPGPERRFEPGALRAELETRLEQLRWPAVTVSCLGCGACAHTCPTCHCFDIIDQPAGKAGFRVRNWDTCQAVLYSLHASGHNPRPDQAARQRNRIAHKFRIYPERFGPVLCTGCGNCGRNCPVGLGVARTVTGILSPSTGSGSTSESSPHPADAAITS
jgi:ferredoxin